MNGCSYPDNEKITFYSGLHPLRLSLGTVGMKVLNFLLIGPPQRYLVGDDGNHPPATSLPLKNMKTPEQGTTSSL
jgi:hypothetical protein